MADHPVSGGQRMRRLMERTLAEATACGSVSVEAEHVLLALAAEPDSPAWEVLQGAGLDYAALRDALASERARSLGAIGLTTDPGPTLRSTPRTERPHWGNSIKSAFAPDRRPGRDVRGRGPHSGPHPGQRPGPRGGRPGSATADEDRVAAATEAWLAAAEAWSAVAKAGGGADDRAAAERAAAEARRAAIDARRNAMDARRTTADSRRRRADDLYVLVGILGAEFGTVPRALALAGVDRLALLDLARTAQETAYGRGDRL